MDAKKVKELEKVSVKTYGELQQALVPFLKESAIYKLLVEGMEMVKRQAEFADRVVDTDPAAYGGYIPAAPAKGGNYSWVDTLIDRRLNGKREGLKVMWTLPEGKFSFDPWTRKLEQING